MMPANLLARGSFKTAKEGVGDVIVSSKSGFGFETASDTWNFRCPYNPLSIFNVDKWKHALLESVRVQGLVIKCPFPSITPPIWRYKCMFGTSEELKLV